MRVLKPEWLPLAKPHRIIIHWTAGGYQASSVDLEHYHFLIEGDGNVVRGDHTVADNEDTRDDNYAAHTRACNTKSIGVSVCCMLGAVEKPFTTGPYPMKQIQWDRMADVVADLCEHYMLKVTPSTVLGHGEVENTLHIPQRGKWDPMTLPWKHEMGKAAVGDSFRRMVLARLSDD